MFSELISVVIPVYNEADNIQPCLRSLASALEGVEHELLVCYDFDADTTLPAIALMADRPATVRLVKNDIGKGVANALRAGFRAARGDVVVTTMADLSDPPSAIPAMVRKVRAGAAVVSGSRYMRGGSQVGGPRLKAMLSRAAGLSLCWIGGLGTHDATNNFRAYSRRFLEETPLESTAGFEVALELTVKAHVSGRVVDEVPSTWTDRTAGQSRFLLAEWLPKYLRWYLRAMLEPSIVWSLWVGFAVWLLVLVAKFGVNFPHWDEYAHIDRLTGAAPVTLEWLWSQHNEHRIPLGRLLWLGLFRLTDGNYRAPMFVSAGLLISAGFALITAVRHMRGRLVLSDVALPLAIMGVVHAENLLWGHQVVFTASVATFCWVVALGLSEPIRTSARRLRDHACGLAVTSLVFWGGQGAILVPPLAACAAIRGKRLWREDRAAALRWLGWGAVASTCFALYVAGFTSYNPQPSAAPATVAMKLAFFARFLTAGLNPAWSMRPGNSWLMLACAVLGIGVLVLRWRSTSWQVRDTLVAALAAILLLAAATAHARGMLGPSAAFAPRYVTLAAPGVCALYLAATLGPRWRPGTLAANLVALIVASQFSANTQIGLRYARDHQKKLTSAAANAAFSDDLDAYALSHPTVFPEPARLAASLKQLRDERASVFAPGEAEQLRTAYLGDKYPMLLSAPNAVDGSSVRALGDGAEGFLVVEPPGTITYERSRGSYRLTAKFALPPEVDEQTTGDGATFRVVLHQSPGEQVLFERHLDPRRIPADRGVHTLDLPFTINDEQGTVELQTLPGPAGDVAFDWAQWSKVRLRREF